ncbi:hypothetical protein C8A05DRAFT_17830 [Staphylotrichum tortipilum]|uniref:BHLH domain-containing protein n=1 Tax=Staphylotrichum tortipilum TaxID=2831512 RepID=A0AAN6MGK1_9PEZI|nr:hypothetical protein C8A05DRAFT_17830 [Staphylotrichum longicolle]
MDSDPLRHLEFFSMPNNQTVNPADQAFLTASATQPPSIWDTTGLNVDPGLPVSPSTAATTLSLDSVTQPSPLTGLTNVSPDLASTSRPPAQQQALQSRPILPARGPRARDGRERKRSRLSMDATTPLDSVDYWIDFDKDDSLASIAETAEPSRPTTMDTRGKAPMARRPGLPTMIKRDDFLDDSALDNALSDDDGFSSINLADQLSRIDTIPPQDIPPREGLYSTPLSWERPQPGLHMDSFIGLHSPSLNEAEQRRLIAIAMNPGPSMGGLGSNINLNFSGLAPGMPMAFNHGLGGMTPTAIWPGQGPNPVSPPQGSSSAAAGKAAAAAAAAARSTPPKRQESVSDKGKEKQKTGDRTAHNDIERKYRTNLKDKISELKDAVPALQTILEEGGGGGEDDTQPSRTAKVSKGTVLTKATEYIHFLERRNKQIVQEHRELSRRLQAFEQLLNATARQSYTMPTYSRTLFDPRGFC